jgi:hypothetical protein
MESLSHQSYVYGKNTSEPYMIEILLGNYQIGGEKKLQAFSQ